MNKIHDLKGVKGFRDWPAEWINVISSYRSPSSAPQLHSDREKNAGNAPQRLTFGPRESISEFLPIDCILCTICTLIACGRPLNGITRTADLSGSEWMTEFPGQLIVRWRIVQSRIIKRLSPSSTALAGWLAGDHDLDQLNYVSMTTTRRRRRGRETV